MSNAKLRYAQLRETMKPGDFVAYCQKGEKDGDGWKVCNELFTDRAEYEAHFTKVHKLRKPDNKVGSLKPQRWKPPTQRPVPVKRSTDPDLLESSDWIDPGDLQPGMRFHLVGSTVIAEYAVLDRDGDSITLRQVADAHHPEKVGEFSIPELRDRVTGFHQKIARPTP